MDRTQKSESLASLKEKLAKAQSLVIADFRGLTVDKDTAMRNEFRKAGCEYKVVKNKLLGLAVKDTAMASIKPLLAGPTAIAYSFEDAGAPAKVLTKFAKGEEKLQIKGGYVDGKALDANGVEMLSKMPGKDEMRATFLATLNAVPQTFMRLLNAAPQSFVYLLKAREDQQK
ncbi:MAG: 50S ribosomal protein L10 [Myxococcales bacterium]|nr:50S ribosomal protein L10 [Myxococcales bacterium]